MRDRFARIPGARKLRRLVRKLTKRRRHQRRLYELPSYYTTKATKKVRLDRDVLGFSAIANATIAEGRTFLSHDRLHMLWQGLAAAPEGSSIVEIGVYRGGSTKFLCCAARWMNRDVSVFACDTFAGHAAVDEELDGRHAQEGRFTGTTAEEVRAYLDGESVEVVVGDIVETADRIPHGPIGFLHLDVDVYPSTKFCLDRFSPQIPMGSMIVVDDYGFVTCVGAKQAVDEFIESHPEWRRLHLLTGQAVLIRVGSPS